MAQVFEIPLLASQPQTMTINLGDVVYKMLIQWRDAAGTWIMDLLDSNGNGLLVGVPLVPGLDIMAQYTDLNFPGQLWITVDADPLALPTFAGLGITSHLLYVIP